MRDWHGGGRCLAGCAPEPYHRLHDGRCACAVQEQAKVWPQPSRFRSGWVCCGAQRKLVTRLTLKLCFASVHVSMDFVVQHVPWAASNR